MMWQNIGIFGWCGRIWLSHYIISILEYFVKEYICDKGKIYCGIFFPIHVQMFTLTCLIFEFYWPFATHYNFTPMNVIEQVTWIAKNATHRIYDHILMQTQCNLVATQSQQLFFNYYATPLWLQPWFHIDIIFHPFIKIQHVTLWKKLVIDILISIVQYDYSF